MQSFVRWRDRRQVGLVDHFDAGAEVASNDRPAEVGKSVREGDEAMRRCRERIGAGHLRSHLGFIRPVVAAARPTARVSRR